MLKVECALLPHFYLYYWAWKLGKWAEMTMGTVFSVTMPIVACVRAQ